ncbi:hypothetical protein COEREDRAFT_81513 [Coemansia reversa NRRL 1564]|uniref:AB hydrolase-1 domain-containing protein n=1 Tax=Coemansia reversa (strain ATCC 12441 / NRRL 1564) TaxID=763665 RepID=A0A2G5BAM5_COERN|nr:hypothetical protein COEREDRAFT_81513 [Coemansia reversa NRRL 1564]|eukprot:PIA16068.1 hypothetical protein COEREDRAFT_81513 [Coemansia reversa NRRL 1564]
MALIGLVLSFQALFVISAYRSVNRYLYWTIAWIIYGAMMGVFAVCVVAGYATTDGSASAWAAFWLFPAAAIVVFAAKARRGYAVDRVMGIPEFRPRLADSRGAVLAWVALDNVFPWVGWVICLFFGLLVVIQALATANDHNRYSRPGALVPVQTNGGEDWYKLHVWCHGYGSSEQADSNSPVFVLLTEFGMPSTAMEGLAKGIAANGHPACIVDRPGYGWSEPGYWAQDPVEVVKSINQALTKYPIANPIVLVGWGEGGVWSQLYMQAADYTRVIGMVLLDTYPNMEILQTYALNRTTTLQNLRQFRSYNSNGNSDNDIPQVHFDKGLESSISQKYSSWRAASPLALHRSRNGGWSGFQPSESLGMHRSLFRNNLYYQARYFEYGGTGSSLYQTLLGYATSSTEAVLVYHHWPLRWPSLRAESGNKFISSTLKRRDTPPTEPASYSNLPVVIIASAHQFNSDCGAQRISNSEDCTKWQAFAWFYYRQQIEYQQTLSQNAALLACTGPVQEDSMDCNEDFVWRRPNWLAKVIVNQLFKQADNATSSTNNESTTVTPEASSTSTTT